MSKTGIMIVLVIITTVILVIGSFIYDITGPHYYLKDIRPGGLTLSEKYEIFYSEYYPSSEILEEHGYYNNASFYLMENQMGNVGYTDYKFKDGSIADISLRQYHLKDEYCKGGLCTQLSVSKSNPEVYVEESVEKIIIENNDYVVDSDYNPSPKHVEEAFGKWKHDMNEMFDEYVKIKYNCEYEVSC